MATFCLLPKIADQFIAKIKSGDLDPAKLADMSSKERRDVFESVVGKENATQVNQLFESKLLLKNQQQGIINWAKQVAGLKPEALKDITSRVNRMTELLNPTEEKAFLKDLAAHKLGTTVTMGEAAKISELAKETADKKEAIDRGSADGSNSRLDYGRSLVELQDYTSDLKNDAKKLTLKERLQPKNYGENLTDLGGLTKSLKASLDLSAIFRQGAKLFFTDNGIWRKNSLDAFKNFAKSVGGKEVMNEVRADVLSRENNLNGLYKKEGLAVGTTEEQFPTSIQEKTPILGRLFKASEDAFTAFQYKTRADVFDNYVKIAEKSGADIQGIGKVANSLTGRGTFGQRGESAASAVNNLVFSPRLLKSHVDLLTAHAFDANIGSFARKQAAINMVKVIGGMAGIMAIANAVNPGSAEKDPRSSDFGKIKVGDTRFDYTGGMASMATLASRLFPLLAGQKSYSKSTSTGKLNEINAKDKKGNPLYGGTTGLDVLYDFGTNKVSPLFGTLVIDQLRGHDFDGNPNTLVNKAKNLFEPLPINTWEQLKNNPNSANIIASMIADGLGISTNTYAPPKKK